MKRVEFAGLLVRIERGDEWIDHRFNQALADADDQHPNPHDAKQRERAPLQLLRENDDETPGNQAGRRNTEQPAHADEVQQRTANGNSAGETKKNDSQGGGDHLG